MHSDNRYCPSARESGPDVEGNVEGKGGSGGQVPVVSGRIIQHIQYPGHSASKPAHTSSLLPCGSRGAQHPGIDAIQRGITLVPGRLWEALGGTRGSELVLLHSYTGTPYGPGIMGYPVPCVHAS